MAASAALSPVEEEEREAKGEEEARENSSPPLPPPLSSAVASAAAAGAHLRMHYASGTQPGGGQQALIGRGHEVVQGYGGWHRAFEPARSRGPVRSLARSSTSRRARTCHEI